MCKAKTQKKQNDEYKWPDTGKTYILSLGYKTDRKVKYLGNRTLCNGIKQFQVKFLDKSKNTLDEEFKKNDTKWLGNWYLKRLKK